MLPWGIPVVRPGTNMCYPRTLGRYERHVQNSVMTIFVDLCYEMVSCRVSARVIAAGVEHWLTQAPYLRNLLARFNNPPAPPPLPPPLAPPPISLFK